MENDEYEGSSLTSSDMTVSSIFLVSVFCVTSFSMSTRPCQSMGIVAVEHVTVGTEGVLCEIVTAAAAQSDQLQVGA